MILQRQHLPGMLGWAAMTEKLTCIARIDINIGATPGSAHCWDQTWNPRIQNMVKPVG